ncbi:GGL domain-containing protein [Jimgerdemannia flammicorona]|uniref:Guanine nucleotide-binding protein subunit gamma n=1 Tax=Jimgerdemannia flammicorona TaxID=994334 RepID=A0A433Q0V6_9FUNG|nr:GGL domain-containing protein [Jimgerdemannia flammicorona]
MAESSRSSNLAITLATKQDPQTLRSSTPLPDTPEEMTRNLQENKLQKQLDLNNRLREILERNAVPASEACQTLLKYVSTTTDYLLPALWGEPEENPYVVKSKPCGCVII